MKQLGGLDTTFLHMESPRTPMHIGSLNIYSQATAQDGLVTFKGILSMIEERLHLAGSFRERLVAVPMSLDNPYWIQDPDFDLEFHVRHVALPAPGDWRQLCIQVARLHSRPLDLDRPLWEFTVIEGLDNIAGIPKGSFAIASKVHHAAIDGVSGAEITAAIHELSADPEPVPAPAKRWKPERVPEPLELLARAGINNVRQPLRVPKLLVDTLPALRQLRSPDLDLPTAPKNVPKTRFGGKVTAHRVFEGRTFDLAGVKAMKNAVPGATVNDVVLTICGGAIRRYLDAHDELPESSLVAMAPVSVRSNDEKGSAGNKVAAMSVALRTDIVEPLARLEAVHATSQSAKELTHAVGAKLMTDYAEHLPSVTMAMASRLYSRLGNRAPIFNCVITNVPGPQIPLYSAGAEMVATYGYGPILDGLGLFMPILSYNGRLSIGVTSCREMMPDPEFFASCIAATHDELALAAAVALNAAAPPPDVSADKPRAKKPKKKATTAKASKPSSAKAGTKKAPPKKSSTKKAQSKS